MMSTSQVGSRSVTQGVRLAEGSAGAPNVQPDWHDRDQLGGLEYMHAEAGRQRPLPVLRPTVGPQRHRRGLATVDVHKATVVAVVGVAKGGGAAETYGGSGRRRGSSWRWPIG